MASIAKKPVSNMKDSGAVASNNLCERRLVFRACVPRQFEIGGLFVTVRQKRSSIGVGGLDRESAASAGGGLFVIARPTHSAATAAMVLELRFQLIELGFLIGRQN